MPLHWIIDSKDRIVTAVAEGYVTRAEVEDYLNAMIGADALAYRRLFDGSLGETTMTGDDMMVLGVLFRNAHMKYKVGPLAVVVPEDKTELVSRVLGILATADRPMRVFHEIEPARRWIESLPN